MFFPPANPGRISEKINQASSLFTTGVSRGTITNSMGRILRSQWIQDADITLLMIACIVVMLGVIACAAGACMSLGNRKMRRRGLLFPALASRCGGAQKVRGNGGRKLFSFFFIYPLARCRRI